MKPEQMKKDFVEVLKDEPFKTTVKVLLAYYLVQGAVSIIGIGLLITTVYVVGSHLK